MVLKILLILLILFFIWVWVYGIYRLQCWLFNFYLKGDELSTRAKMNARRWGWTGAIVLGAVPALWLQSVLEKGPGNPQDIEAFLAVLAGPVIEEIAKGIAPLAAYFMLARPSGRKLFVIGLLSGSGFYLFETLLYSFGALNNSIDPGAALAQELVIRAIAIGFLHPISAGMTGLGLGLAAASNSKFVKMICVMAGFGLGCFFHIWNNGVAMTNMRGGRLDQTEFFGIHVFVLVMLLVAARVRIFFKQDAAAKPEVTVAKSEEKQEMPVSAMTSTTA